MELINFKERLSGRRLKMLQSYVMLGILMVAFFSGKSRVDIESIAVSPNEQYIACFETGNGHKIHCFQSDGSMAFTYNIPVDISSGGHCTLWFEDDILCALFYRTDKILYFTLDGSILNIADNTAEESPPKFPSFARRYHQYVFDGNEIDVVYDKGSFLGYWLFGSERYLAITLKSGEMKILYTWTAKEGISKDGIIRSFKQN